MWILQFDLNQYSIEEVGQIHNAVSEMVNGELISIPQSFILKECTLDELESIRANLDDFIEKRKLNNDL